MTKIELEELRNKNRDNLVEIYNKVARMYEKFANVIKAGGILTDNDFGELNEMEFVTVPFKDENLMLTYLFSDAAEDEVKEND